MKSGETSGSDVVSKTDFKIPFSAFLKIIISSSSFVSLLDRNLKSTSETFGVGTLIALPSILPFNCGSTSPTALAAPVEVGIIEISEFLARRKSLCIVSMVF